MSTIGIGLGTKLRTCTKARLALLGALVLAGLALNALTLLADSKLWQRTPALAVCALLPDQAERLACYDRTQEEVTSHPFRGANAPVHGRL